MVGVKKSSRRDTPGAVSTNRTDGPQSVRLRNGRTGCVCVWLAPSAGRHACETQQSGLHHNTGIDTRHQHNAPRAHSSTRTMDGVGMSFDSPCSKREMLVVNIAQPARMGVQPPRTSQYEFTRACTADAMAGWNAGSRPWG